MIKKLIQESAPFIAVIGMFLFMLMMAFVITGQSDFESQKAEFERMGYINP